MVENVRRNGRDTSKSGLPGSSLVTIASNVEWLDVPIAEVTEISNRSMSVTEFEETLKEIDRSLSVDSRTLLPDGKNLGDTVFENSEKANLLVAPDLVQNKPLSMIEFDSNKDVQRLDKNLSIPIPKNNEVPHLSISSLERVVPSTSRKRKRSWTRISTNFTRVRAGEKLEDLGLKRKTSGHVQAADHEKKVKFEEETLKLSVLLATNFELVEIARKPRREQ